jgi:1,4-alpha-glucan branching enzyme
MFEKGQKAGSYKFSIKPVTAAKKVAIAGDFNGWKPTSLRKQKDGSFAITIAMTAGTYEYKYIIDDCWAEDPDNPTWSLNAFGTINSVITAG